MTNDILDHLKSLHTSAIDARNGYQEALKQADGKGMTPLFREMMELHERNAAELARALARDNEIADEKGSFMTVIHETIMDVRSMFNGLEESVLPGLIDGEKRNVSKYDDAILSARTRPIIANFLATQRDSIVKKIAAMEAQKAANDHTANWNRMIGSRAAPDRDVGMKSCFSGSVVLFRLSGGAVFTADTGIG